MGLYWYQSHCLGLLGKQVYCISLEFALDGRLLVRKEVEKLSERFVFSFIWQIKPLNLSFCWKTLKIMDKVISIIMNWWSCMELLFFVPKNLVKVRSYKGQKGTKQLVFTLKTFSKLGTIWLLLCMASLGTWSMK